MRTALIFSGIFLSACLGVLPGEVEEPLDLEVIDDQPGYFSMCKAAGEDGVKISAGTFIDEGEPESDPVAAMVIKTEAGEYFLDIEHLDSGDVVGDALVPSTFDCSQKRTVIFLTDL
tara:strand:- start:274 stop:624 length:351 start_codon:yes stop_codon:yes gene_type:complete